MNEDGEQKKKKYMCGEDDRRKKISGSDEYLMSAVKVCTKRYVKAIERT
jgi:hypothetical protein